MTRVLYRTVPLLLLATLLLSANPARSGGRDVPENKSGGSDSTDSAWPGDLPCVEEPALVWVGGVPFSLTTRADGTVQLEPSLTVVWGSLLDAARSLGLGDDGETSCP